MLVSYISLLILLITAPLDLFWMWPGGLGIRLLVAGIGLFFAVRFLRERETAFLKSILGYVSLGLSLMAIWLLIQIIPLSFFAHPFWLSAAEALKQPLHGRMSLDVGGSVLAFCRLILSIATGFLTAILAIDRRRAEQILLVLTIIAGLVLESLLFGNIWPAMLGFFHSQKVSDDLVIFASLTLVLSFTYAVCSFERFETRRSHQIHPLRALILRELGSLFVFFVATQLIWLTSNPALVLVAAVGIALPGASLFVRRLNLDPFLNGFFLVMLVCTLFSVAAVLYFHLIDLHPSNSAVPSSTEAQEAIMRMLGDAPAVGTGAGSFSSLLPLYQNQTRSETLINVPGTWILQIELGRSAFWLLVFCSIAFIFRLMRCSLLRGRDFFYTSAGAGCLSVMLIDLFVSAGIFLPSNWIFASAIMGLALAQTQSRSNQD